MTDQKCLNCPEYKRCRDSWVSWLFFAMGLTATFAVRAVTVLADINPVWGKVSWYIGIIGFLLFFLYKYRVDKQRSELIYKKGIIDKFGSGKQLSKEDYAFVSVLLCALTSNKDRINYFFIFSSSVIALSIAVYFDFIK